MSNISFEQSPPYFVTVKFFLTAPLFLILSGVVLIFSSDYFGLLAAIHSFTLGFLTFSVFGALWQMLPVLAGVYIKRSNLISYIVYGCLTIGVFAFMFGFLFNFIGLHVAMLFLGIAFLLFVTLTLYKILTVQFFTPTITGMGLALLGLLILFSGGVLRVLEYLGVHLGLNAQVLHVNFALFGFIFMLIVAITYQVLPMFYVAKEYNKTFQKWFLPTVFALVVLLQFVPFAILGLHVSMLIYAIYSIKVISSRKRKFLDTTIRFWLLGFYSLIICALLGLISWFVELPTSLFTLIFLFGFAGSIISTMLYKIVPFLSYFHLTSTGNFFVPSIKEMISEKPMFVHFVVYLLFLVSLLVGAFFENLHVGGVLLTLSGLICSYNLLKVLSIYNKFAKQEVQETI